MTEAVSDARAVPSFRRAAPGTYGFLFDQGDQHVHLVAPANDGVASALGAAVSDLPNEIAGAAP